MARNSLLNIRPVPLVPLNHPELDGTRDKLCVSTERKIGVWIERTGPRRYVVVSGQSNRAGRKFKL